MIYCWFYFEFNSLWRCVLSGKPSILASVGILLDFLSDTCLFDLEVESFIKKVLSCVIDSHNDYLEHIFIFTWLEKI